MLSTTGVSPNTKIQIWKQITTQAIRGDVPVAVYHPIQKYKFESKSQRIGVLIALDDRCITQYKNTNLKANHNAYELREAYKAGVSPNTKIQIWKQITTIRVWPSQGRQVYHPIQKYKFESKSQRLEQGRLLNFWCITQYKNTNLKANHNAVVCGDERCIGVSPNTKIQIWKQITTTVLTTCFQLWVYHPIQKYKFESKSQRSWGSPLPWTGCITQYKNTNLKANHNYFFFRRPQCGGVSPNTKIQIWKQITTTVMLLLTIWKVYHPIQKYKFESKSQLSDCLNLVVIRCITQYKNTNLKANHNVW